MQRYITLSIWMLALTTNAAFAHQDFYVIKDYGNIKVRIKTGFDYEEINKALIIAQLAEKLSKNLDYSKPIFLDFNHYYVGDCQADYFLSYDKGKKEYEFSDKKWKTFLTKNAIVVTQVSRKFDVVSTLKLVEYGIRNFLTLDKDQKMIHYHKKYCNWAINTIDSMMIKEQLEVESSSLLSTLLKTRIERPREKFEFGVSYFWQDCKYHFYLKEDKKPDSLLFNVDNVYHINKVNNYSAMVFDTDSSFYFAYQFNKPIVSKRQVIINTNSNFQPFKIDNISREKILIQFWYYSKEEGRQPRERALIYLTEKDELIQDLDVLIDKR